VLVVHDPPGRRIGEAFAEAAKAIGAAVAVERVPVAERSGVEPAPAVAARMRSADVALLVTKRSLSWTEARRAATAGGTRVASMPGLTEETLLRTLAIDYETIRARVNRICDRLDAAGRARLVSDAGTDLRLSIEGRQAHGRKGGLYREAGQWGNLPAGEAFLAPVEGSASGVYVVDASHAGVGRLERPIRIQVETGRATRIEGGEEAERLRRLLESVGDPAAFNLAELGIGCNPAARICGLTLEDEKVLGTAHLALGRNDLFGGTVGVAVHLDGILTRPRIWLDGEELEVETGEG
jgi:leucyl aminopeptidase (aminopeptidase T)